MKKRRHALRLRAWSGPVAVATVLALGAATGADAFGAAAYAATKPAPKAEQVPAVHAVTAVKSTYHRPAAPMSYVATRTRWPAASTTDLELAAPPSATADGVRSTAAAAPVWARSVAPGKSRSYTGPGSLHVRVLDHSAAEAADVPGVLMTVTADHPGASQVGLDYDSFAEAYGGDYGSRLTLVTYPSCLLTTPSVAKCHQATALSSARNNSATTTVAATVNVAASTDAVVLAAESTPNDGDGGGKAGTFSATPLAPSGTWNGGTSSGSFTYAYGMDLPTANGLKPQIGLSYDSSVPDGQTAATQAQASWAGEGWSTPDSSIEQSFQTCSQSPEGSAAPAAIADQCYDGPILNMSLNGSSAVLVWDKTKSVFKAQSADGTTITHYCTLPPDESSFSDPTCVAGTSNGTGSYFNDWYQVVKRDGTVYDFGRNRLPGWASATNNTNSVATEPVYSAHSGDPCYKSTFAASVCTTPYRWGLDYAVDVHGSAMAYYYHQETNYYGADNGASMKPYTRDEYLTHIDYGFTDGHAYGTVADQITFAPLPRCTVAGCTAISSSNKAQFPDVPYDLICASGATCAAHSPSYFSTIRLGSVVTSQYSTTAGKQLPIDTYTFNESTPGSGDATDPTLWLSSVTHSGSDYAGGASTSAIALPTVTFTPQALPNRVDSVTDGLQTFDKMRLQKITTETGSEISVDYELVDPCTAPVQKTASSNTSSCYPVSWTPYGYPSPINDWFNKYVVQKVVQTDPTGGAPAISTSYDYQGGAAWHYDDNELVKPKYRTYGQFRGYGDVITYTGDGANDRQTKSETVYYRGMSKDNNTTEVDLPDSVGGRHEDLNQLAGTALETRTYLGGNVDHSTITSYWISDAVASRQRSGLPDLTANLVVPVEQFNRQAITSGGTTTYRQTETDTSYNPATSDVNFGLPTAKYTHTVPVDAAYDRCGTTTYAAADTGKNLVGLTAQEEADAVACGGYQAAGSTPSVPASVNTLTAPKSVSRPDQVVSATRTFYDDPDFSPAFPQAAPAEGEVTMIQQASGYSGGAFTWQIKARTKYDSAGRATDAYDGNGNHTHTDYTDNAVGVTTALKITNALGQYSQTTLEPARGSVQSSTDLNGVVTTAQYDALGRAKSVWLNSRWTATSPPGADRIYTYALAAGQPAAVTTQTLNDESTYITSVALYDGLLRPRQTQEMTPQGGRLVTDTYYDSRGWVSAKYTDWWDSKSTPGTAIVHPDVTSNSTVQIPKQDFYTYDELGRQIVDQNEQDGTEKSRTTTIYQGDRTTVIPPSGGTAQTTITNPAGQTTEVDSYLTPPSVTAPSDTFTGTFQVTGGTTSALRYGYDAHGNQNSTVQVAASGANPTWTSTFNLLGQVTSTADPDAGSTTNMQYDQDGNLTQATDPLGNTVSTTFDALSRKIGTYAAATKDQTLGASGNQTGAWVYDNSNQAVTGMHYPIGQLTTTETYIGGNTYTAQQNDFNLFGEALSSTVTIPSAEDGLAGTYTVKHSYSSTIGLPAKDNYSAQGGLPQEGVLHTYQPVFDLPNNVSGLGAYSQKVTYDAYGRVNDEQIGPVGNISEILPTYDLNNGRLTDQLVTHTTGTTPATAVTTTLDEQAYKYDQAGNVLSQTDTRSGDAAESETQCFGFDGLDELAAAWTASDKCTVTPTASNSSMVSDNLGTGSAYWTTWQFDDLGDRSNQVQHSFAGGPNQDVTTSYGYGSQPHTATSATTTGANPSMYSYGYDAAGNMTTRYAGQGNQTLSYDKTGQLTGITGSTGGDSHFEYTADGTLLIQKDPGTTTLYLGDQQFSLNASTGVVTGTRYYSLPGGGSVVRTGSTATSFKYAFADNHGTPSLYLDNTGQNPTWRQYTPYGDARGASVTAPDNRGFLDKPLDGSTGLTIIGARQYDPTIGRFVTVDPALEKSDPTAINGYGYAGNNPVVKSDPTGLRPEDPDIDTQFGEPKAGTGSYDEHYVGSPSNKGGTGGAYTGSSSSCDDYCQWLHKPTPNQPTLDQRCGGRGWVPASVCHKGAFTYADALEMGSSNTDNWYWSCAYVMEMDPGKCERQDPFANPHGMSAGLAIVALFATAYTGGLVGVAALPEVILFQATQDVSVLSGGSAALAGEGTIDSIASKMLSGLEYDGATTAEADLAGALRDFCEGGNSFAPDTPVLLADGKTEPIKDLKVGDKVASIDPVTAFALKEPITQLHDNLDTDLADLTVSVNGRTAIVHTTQKHPVWDLTTLKWTPVAALNPGDRLATTAAATIRVVGVRSFTGSRHMLNLTVATLHTFFVLAGNTPILVHNAGCDVELGPGIGDSDALRSWTSTTAETEFIFDPATGKFLAGDRTPPATHNSGPSPHEQLVAQMGADPKSIVGGTMYRESDGSLVFTQSSGHFGQNWTPDSWQQFQEYMGNYGISAEYRPWG